MNTTDLVGCLKYISIRLYTTNSPVQELQSSIKIFRSTEIIVPIMITIGDMVRG